MSIGIWQIVLILVVVLIVFGAGKLPSVMGDVGKGMKNFKQGLNGEDGDDDKKDGDAAKITENKSVDTEAAKDSEKSETKAG